MLFDKVLSQTFSTDSWQATTAISADYSAEVIFCPSTLADTNAMPDTELKFLLTKPTLIKLT